MIFPLLFSGNLLAQNLSAKYFEDFKLAELDSLYNIITIPELTAIWGKPNRITTKAMRLPIRDPHFPGRPQPGRRPAKVRTVKTDTRSVYLHYKKYHIVVICFAKKNQSKSAVLQDTTINVQNVTFYKSTLQNREGLSFYKNEKSLSTQYTDPENKLTYFFKKDKLNFVGFIFRRNLTSKYLNHSKKQ